MKKVFLICFLLSITKLFADIITIDVEALQNSCFKDNVKDCLTLQNSLELMKIIATMMLYLI